MVSPVGTTDPMFVEAGLKPALGRIFQGRAGLKPAPTLSSLTGLTGLLCRSVPAMNRRPTIEASILDAIDLRAGLGAAAPMTLAEQKKQSFA